MGGDIVIKAVHFQEVCCQPCVDSARMCVFGAFEPTEEKWTLTESLNLINVKVYEPSLIEGSDEGSTVFRFIREI